MLWAQAYDMTCNDSMQRSKSFILFCYQSIPRNGLPIGCQ